MRYGTRKVEEPRVLGIVILSLVAAIGFRRTQRRSRPTARIGEDVISPRKVYRLGTESSVMLPFQPAKPEHYATHLQGGIPSSSPK